VIVKSVLNVGKSYFKTDKLFR